MRPLFLWGWLLVMASPYLSSAQTPAPIPFEATFYFETANHTNYQVDPAALATVLSYSQSNPDQPLIVQGHTDNQGDTLSNLQLSEARALTIKQALVQAGVAPERIQVKALGERYPLYDNNYVTGRQRNRRVEVFITDKVQHIHLTQALKNKRILEKLRPTPAQFALGSSSCDTFFVTPSGTRLYIPAQAFDVAEGQTVTVALREAYTFGDMLLNGLSTTSNGALLTTGGMFEIEATSEGERVYLKDGKGLSIQVPTDSVLAEMQLYEMDTTTTAVNWVNPRSFTMPPALQQSSRRQFEHKVSCNLESLLTEHRQRTPLQERADSAKSIYLAVRIPSLKLFAGDSIARVMAMNVEQQKHLNGVYDKPCKGFFCQLGKLFEGRRTKAAKDSTVAKVAAIDEKLALLQARLDKERALENAHRQIIDEAVAEQRRLREIYKGLEAAVKREQETTVQSTYFERQYDRMVRSSYHMTGTLLKNCYYPTMPDSLRPYADADRHLALLYYQQNLGELAHYYPQHEALICQRLYQVATYKEAGRAQRYLSYYADRNLEALEQYYPEREAEACQQLFNVATYPEAKREQRYEKYCYAQDLERLAAEFPEREQLVCQRLYRVNTYAEAQQVKLERIFMRYCEAYNVEGLEKYFPGREREVCLLLYNVPTFEEAKVLKAQRDRLQNTFYTLQLSNKSLGRWMNLDYLSKLPPEDLLVQTVHVKAPLMREDFLIYGDTKAMTSPSQRSAGQSKYQKVVRNQSHTLISYYAIDDDHVALGVKTFHPKTGMDIALTYERLTLEDFAERLAEFN